MSFLDFILPGKICVLCGMKKASKYGLCSDCLSQFNFIKEPMCSLCGKPLNENYLSMNIHICPDCIGGRIFDEARSTVEYTDKIHDIIYLFKYKGKMNLIDVFGEMMIDTFKKWHPQVDVIMPIPMHTDKLKTRGYNQAMLLSKYISNKTKIPHEEYIIKSKPTWAQAKLGKEKRRKNIIDSFKLKVSTQNPLKEKNILVIDDILTTGATADAAASILKSGGAKSVRVLTIATGRNI